MATTGGKLLVNSAQWQDHRRIDTALDACTDIGAYMSLSVAVGRIRKVYGFAHTGRLHIVTVKVITSYSAIGEERKSETNAKITIIPSEHTLISPSSAIPSSPCLLEAVMSIAVWRVPVRI